MTHTYTDQEAFDVMVTHLLTMPVQASDEEGCKYRTLDGENCCLVGKLIPDDDYDPIMEGGAGDDVLEKVGITGINGDLIFKMQNLHDDDSIWTAPDYKWDDPLVLQIDLAIPKLMTIAATHGLSLDVLRTL